MTKTIRKYAVMMTMLMLAIVLVGVLAACTQDPDKPSNVKITGDTTVVAGGSVTLSASSSTGDGEVWYEWKQGNDNWLPDQEDKKQLVVNTQASQAGTTIAVTLRAKVVKDGRESGWEESSVHNITVTQPSTPSIPPENIIINSDITELPESSTSIQLTATVGPNGTAQTVTWTKEGDTENVISLINANTPTVTVRREKQLEEAVKVTIKASVTGHSTITPATKEITIQPGEVAPEVTVTPPTSDIHAKGKDYQLQATVTPAQEAAPTFTFAKTAGADSVATVTAQGVLTPLAQGTVQVTATATIDGKTITSQALTITILAEQLKGVTLATDHEDDTFISGEVIHFMAIPYGYDMNDPLLEITYSNIVSNNPILSGFAPGDTDGEWTTTADSDDTVRQETKVNVSVNVIVTEDRDETPFTIDATITIKPRVRSIEVVAKNTATSEAITTGATVAVGTQIDFTATAKGFDNNLNFQQWQIGSNDYVGGNQENETTNILTWTVVGTGRIEIVARGTLKDGNDFFYSIAFVINVTAA